jgi:2-polyprenyl-3-methyl-5-hydroxy-6-metoxy-1,4-benzoquinol methylase
MNTYYFAQLDDANVVQQVVCVSEADAPTEEIGIAFCKSLFGQDTKWLQTSPDGEFRLRFAGVGMNYDQEADVFYGSLPHDGFTYELDKTKWEWVPTNKPPIYVGFAPTPVSSIEQIFDSLNLGADEKFVDLGCGDGQIVITAAKRGMESTGIEANPALYRQSQIDADLADVPATFIEGDLVNTDLTPYTIIYMYLGQPLCDAVLPKIQALPAGCTIISGDYAYPNWAPIQSYDLGDRKFYAWKT